jgi:hypothetical protein
MKVSVASHAGAFAEDKDIARRFRQQIVEISLAKGERIVLDFSGVERLRSLSFML